jgi:hypothetical protein
VTQGLALGMPDAHTIRLFWRSEGWLIIQVAADTLAACMPPVILDPGATEVLALALTLSEPRFSPSRN